ncbi:endonuclease domain-containing protein [Marivirga harenae]|uniref:endonuclease domain-containing protein n=1 Tax=Marivirga harenae TaxID=2010992 RepID=UPI0026DF0D38|nr:endonuclease domain-containing protein [Marivirga harenae]WKV13008.1 endonuclease domain-containing protein [Marivirga harenae]
MKNYQINNRPELKENRKRLRNNGTSAEAFLWNYLKGKQLKSRKFRRQFSVGNYILDFYCPAEKLCIELDGANHFTSAGFEYDKKRTEYLNTIGITVVRFENKIVFESIENVLEDIMSNFKEE